MATDVLATDALRVVAAVPVFAYASYLDIQERRVPHRTWLPLAAVAVVAFAGDLLMRDPREVVLLALVSLALGVAFGYGFYYLGTFGGADRYALVVIAGAFPVYPGFTTPLGDLPLVVPELPVFVLSVLGNTVVVGAAYPLRILAENLSRRTTHDPGLALLARRVALDEAHTEYGRVIGGEDASVSLSGALGGGGVGNLDFVRDYLEWRGADSLAEIDEDTDLLLDDFVDETGWESDDTERDAEELRDLVSNDVLWISPGIPFVVPMFLGILLALTYGDILFSAMRVAFGL